MHLAQNSRKDKETMVVKEIELEAEGNLVLDQETLGEAGLGKRIRLLIQKGEIRILPEAATQLEKELEDLAGCLGQEPATDYDFSMKIGGLYEAR
jgi:hypothetical protein